MPELKNKPKMMTGSTFKAPEELLAAINQVALNRSTSTEKVSASAVLRKAALADPDIAREYRRILKQSK